MGQPVARVGDPTSHGGTIVSGALKTRADQKLVSRLGDLHTCPIKGHGITPIATGSAKTFVEGKQVARVGDSTACGAVIIQGSPKTFAV